MAPLIIARASREIEGRSQRSWVVREWDEEQRSDQERYRTDDPAIKHIVLRFQRQASCDVAGTQAGPRRGMRERAACVAIARALCEKDALGT